MSVHAIFNQLTGEERARLDEFGNNVAPILKEFAPRCHV